jgi:transcriptional regulator with XRE-family HTH domain
MQLFSEREAMQKNNKYKESGFFSRLTEVLRTEKQNWWAKKTGTSQSMVSNYWLKGKHPRGDKIAKILELKNISANWLYFGIGPKDMDCLDEEEIEKKKNLDRQTQLEIIRLAEENSQLKEKILQMKLRLKQDQLVSETEAVYSSKEANLLDDNIVGAFALTRMIIDIIMKMAELYAKDHVDHEKFGSILDWIEQNRVAKKFSTAAMLQELEQIVS